MQGKETVVHAVVKTYNTGVYKLNQCFKIIGLDESYFLSYIGKW